MTLKRYAARCDNERAPRPDRLLRIYRSEPTPRLVALHRALTTERTTATTSERRAFCDDRLPLVAQVLRERTP